MRARGFHVAGRPLPLIICHVIQTQFRSGVDVYGGVVPFLHVTSPHTGPRLGLAAQAK